MRAGFPPKKKPAGATSSLDTATTLSSASLLPKNLTAFLSEFQKLKITHKSFHPESFKWAKTSVFLPEQLIYHIHVHPYSKTQQCGIRRATLYQLSLFPKVNREYFFLPCFSPTLIFLTIQEKSLLLIIIRNTSRFAFLLELATTYFA